MTEQERVRREQALRNGADIPKEAEELLKLQSRRVQH